MNHDLVLILSALIGGGGFAGGIVALVKMRPETTRIVVDAAEGAVVVQKGVISELRAEIDRLSDAVINERDECDRKLAIQQKEIDQLKLSFSKIDERKQLRRQADEDGGLHE